eukprot:6283152-Alexandrium_andersonii.AAC.1
MPRGLRQWAGCATVADSPRGQGLDPLPGGSFGAIPARAVPQGDPGRHFLAAPHRCGKTPLPATRR